MEEALVLGKEEAGGSGWIFTEENYNAGYTSATYTGGTWLLGSKYYLRNGRTVAGNITNGMPTYNGTGFMTGNSGNGHIKITLIESTMSPTSAPMHVDTMLEEHTPANNERINKDTDNFAGETGEIIREQEMLETDIIEEKTHNVETIEKPEAILPSDEEYPDGA